ncbi:unnamed protein product [Ectocarpus sp. 12 AP-2014]
MKFSYALFTGASLLFAAVAVAAKEDTSCSSSTAADADVSGCPDPVGAVLALFDCVTKKDSTCAAAAYDPGFQRYHNEESTGAIAVSDPGWWAGAFSVVDISFDVKFTNKPAPNTASVRYLEMVTTSDGRSLGLPNPRSDYPFDFTVVQHEHAIGHVDDDCKFTFWGQYGDNKEQTDVDVAVANMMSCMGGGPCGTAPA